MANGNGNGWVLKSLVGFLLTTIFAVLMFIGSNVIANDKDSRTRDDKIKENCRISMEKQTIVNQAILISLTEIKSDLKYIKGSVNNGG